jgi:hypothetical protein
MKFRHRYLSPVISYLIVYVFGLLIFGFSTEAVEWIYNYLNHLLPGVFPLYNPIYDPEAHARLNKSLTVVGLLVAFFLINFIALKLENKKYERIISLTDGQYLIKDGIKLYFKEFFISDVITAIVLPILIVVATYFIPDSALGYFGLMLFGWLGYNMRMLYGLIPAIIIVATFSFAGRMLAIPLTVKSWRAAWLSDI